MKTIFVVALTALVASVGLSACQTEPGQGPAAAGAGALVDTAGTAVALAGVAVKGVARGDMSGAFVESVRPVQPAGSAGRRACARWGRDSQGRKTCLTYPSSHDQGVKP